MAKIDQVEISQIDIAPKVKRTDAIQSFVTQETVMVTVRCDDGSAGTGYTYTIGTGGSSIVALLNDHLAPRLIGRDPQQYEAIWRDLFFHTHATAVGAITSLALAAIDTALWDRNARAVDLPLWRLAGGAQQRVPVYTTEGGWLHIEPAQLVEQTLAAKADGFLGAKIKVGKPHVAQDIARLSAVREAVGADFELMVDANQPWPRPSGARASTRRWTWPGSRNRCRPSMCARMRSCWRAPACRSRWASRCTTRRSSPNTSSRAPARSCRPTWRGWAASRRG